jgi:hypothetical protein
MASTCWQVRGLARLSSVPWLVAICRGAAECRVPVVVGFLMPQHCSHPWTCLPCVSWS